VTRFVAPSLLLLAAVSTGVAFARHCPGCIDRGRVNRACEWRARCGVPHRVEQYRLASGAECDIDLPAPQGVLLR
jgi:hypothetical protein